MVKMEDLVANMQKAFNSGKNAVAYVDLADLADVDAHSLFQIYSAMRDAGMSKDNFPIYLGSGYTNEHQLYNPIVVGFKGSNKGDVIYDVLCVSPSNYDGTMGKDLEDLINIVMGSAGVANGKKLSWYKENRDTLANMMEARIIAYNHKVGPVVFILDRDLIDDRYGAKNARAVLEEFAARFNGVVVG